ncbi:MAG: hypothetical protein VKJ46_02255 [Leptolyngbyaceae bacterium]|nr:hypothetical protein [Leptolyngbyaceae bacterium]
MLNNKVEINLPEDNPEMPHYDRHITPAETGARHDREGDQFLHTPSQEQDQNFEAGNPVHDDSIDTTGGYTVDKEGLLNNYAIEPEMYIEVPGDLREQEEAATEARAHELEGLQHDEEGQLTMEKDRRGKGPGII